MRRERREDGSRVVICVCVCVLNENTGCSGFPMNMDTDVARSVTGKRAQSEEHSSTELEPPQKRPCLIDGDDDAPSSSSLPSAPAVVESSSTSNESVLFSCVNPTNTHTINQSIQHAFFLSLSNGLVHAPIPLENPLVAFVPS